jgi:hypothetical protein
MPCADSFRKRPKANLTPWQKKEALRLRGKITKEEIAKRIGASRSAVMRLGRDLNLSFATLKHYKYKLNPVLVQQVCKYYETFGKAKTVKAFPTVNVKCIVDRPKYYGINIKPRQIRWTDDQLKELARMAGIVSQEAQSKHLKRPNAYRGSIKSAWTKKFQMGGGCINGLSWNIARHFVNTKCKPIRTKFWSQRDGIAHNLKGRQVVLWVEMEKHLRPDCPDWIKESIQALSNFQVWLHGTTEVKTQVKRMIRGLET